MMRRLLPAWLVPALLTAACADGPPTFAHDVAPIIHANCLSCHRPGNLAPFSLVTFEEVRDHAPQIVSATSSGEMPPWLPEPGVGRFSNARGLTAAQVTTLRTWAEQGMPRGPVDAQPAVPPAADAGWQLGTPDLVVTLPEAYTLATGDADVFRNFVVPVPMTRARFVRGVEFKPDRPASIHHAVIGVDASGESRRLDAGDPEPGYEGMFSDEFHSPDGHFVGWTPGRTPTLEPDGRAWRLEAGTDLVVQMHMLPGQAPVSLQPRLGLYFSDTPPTTVPFMVKLTSTSIDIPPGDTSYSVEDSYTLPVDVDAVSIYPHAHYLAREIIGTATLPSGQTLGLLTIRHWDFHWQEFYRYESPIALPAGTRLSMRITYDNSPEHQPTPGQPPRRVRYGPRSSDEMGDLWLQVIPRRREELGALARDFVGRRAAARVVAAERAVLDAPGDASAHDRLGASYLAAGRVNDALRALDEARRLAPESAEISNNLGAALLEAGRPREAVPHLRRAARARPSDARVAFNLGNALRDSGQMDDASAAFERVLALNPRAADALNNLAALDGARGRFAQAIARLEQALALREDYPDAHHNLALALAATGRTADALIHVERALTLRPGFEQARQTRAELLQQR